MTEPNALPGDEWGVIEQQLPKGWEQQARSLGAFRRARYMDRPGLVLRLLLFHAVNDGGLRQTSARASAAGLVKISAPGLLKRLRTAGPWLRWIAGGLASEFRERPLLPGGLRPRAVDSTTIQGPGAKSSEWRVHYSLDLTTMACDWHELTDHHIAEGLERTPVLPGDVLLADRNYLRPAGVAATTASGGHVLARMRWTHTALLDVEGQPCKALDLVRSLPVGEVGEWSVQMPVGKDAVVPMRLVAICLPGPLAEKARRRLRRIAQKKSKKVHPRSIEAAGFVMLATTLPATSLDAKGVAALYRYRWQVELAFKRHKQLLKLGRLPHKDPAAAEAWILAKLVVALLLEKLYRLATVFSPWGYSAGNVSISTDSQ